jgi:hypothetical protein
MRKACHITSLYRFVLLRGISGMCKIHTLNYLKKNGQNAPSAYCTVMNCVHIIVDTDLSFYKYFIAFLIVLH